MKIYTKTGDSGETSLFGGDRVSKDANRVDAYGTVDELNAALGVVAADELPGEIAAVIRELQSGLFVLGADIATPVDVRNPSIRRIVAADAERLEALIDAHETKLEPLRNFVLPGGTPAAAHLHVARTVCRRAERAAVRLSRADQLGVGCIVYLNRLSDLLFVLARYVNAVRNVPDVKWNP
jgi:cob(I)alamin adenosyltransferase